MAALNFYLANTLDANGWCALSESAQAAATTASGWTVSTGTTNHSELRAGAERAASTFTGTGVPDGILDATLKDAFRSPNALNGSFASANWTLNFVVRAVTNGGAQDGRVRFRLIKADADGSNAAEITAGQQQASLVSNVSTSADFDSTLTFNPGAFSIVNQYLFVQAAWERTGAGGMTSADVLFRTGSSSSAGTRITTADFTAAQTISGAGAITGAEAFGTAKINFTLLALGNIGTAAAFGTTVLAQANPQTISGAGAIAGAEAFGTAKVNFTLLALGNISTTAAFGTAKINFTLLALGNIGTAVAFGTAKTNFTIGAAGAIAGAEAFGSGRANFTILAAGNLASGEQFGAAAVTQPGAGAQTIVDAGSIASAEAFGAVMFRLSALAAPGGLSVQQHHAWLHQIWLRQQAERQSPPAQHLNLRSIASAEAFGAPSLWTSINVPLRSIASVEAFGHGALSKRPSQLQLRDEIDLLL